MPNPTNEKTKQLLMYLIKKHQRPSVTSLMKLSYLADLISMKRERKQITDFVYKRYNFGPFDEKIYDYLNELSVSNIIKTEPEYSLSGEEYLTYSPSNEKDEYPTNELSDNEIKMIDELLATVSGLGAKGLTEIAYKTKPMRELGATLGGNESMGQILNLQTVVE